MRYFDDFRFDPAHRLLWRDGIRVPLTRKAGALLAALIEAAGQPVSKQTLLETVWPDAHVTPDNIKVLICEIRSALGDSSDEPRYVKTTRRDGYVFIAPVDRVRMLSSSEETFSGRRHELSTIMNRLNAAAHGDRGLLAIDAPAGIGKTALCEAAIRTAADENFIVIQGQCVAFEERAEPFYPLLDALQRLASDVITVRQVIAKQAPLLLAQLLPSHAVSMIGSQRDTDSRPRLREIVNIVEAVAEYAPTLLVVEDVHWSDPSTMDVIGALARRRNNVRLLMIVTHRPFDEYPRAVRAARLLHELTTTRLCATLRPDMLDTDEMLEYLESRFGAEVAKVLVRPFARLTGGYPLFVTTAADHLVETGLLVQDGTQWMVLGSFATIATAITDGVLPLAQRRLDQLSGDDLSVLRAVSRLGMRSPLSKATLRTHAPRPRASAAALSQAHDHS